METNIEILNREGVSISILKNLNNNQYSYGAKIMRDIQSSATCVKEIKSLITFGYVKQVIIKGDIRRQYYSLTLKGKELIQDFITLEKKLYGRK